MLFSTFPVAHAANVFKMINVAPSVECPLCVVDGNDVDACVKEFDGEGFIKREICGVSVTVTKGATVGDDDEGLLGVIGCNFFEASGHAGVAVVDAFAVGNGFVCAAFVINGVGIGMLRLGFGAQEAREDTQVPFA